MNAYFTQEHRWHCLKHGEGRPLVLLHGFGMSHHVWQPIMEHLATGGRQVLAFDLPGFGNTPTLPASTAASVQEMAAALIRELHRQGIDGPVDVVGNSLGGRVALEVARQGGARSVVAISPPGLWPDYLYPPPMVLAFAVARFGPSCFPRLTRRLLRNEATRAALLAIPVAADGRKIPTAEAIRMAECFASAPGLWLVARRFNKLINGRGIEVPCTVAYGRQDRLLPAFARERSRLPAHSQWLEPEGWGHVPMWDDADWRRPTHSG